MVCVGCVRDLPRCVLRHALAWFNTPVGSLPTLPRYWSDPTEVLSRPYRGIVPTLPRYLCDPTEVLLGPYRGIARALPRYCAAPWLYNATTFARFPPFVLCPPSNVLSVLLGLLVLSKDIRRLTLDKGSKFHNFHSKKRK